MARIELESPVTGVVWKVAVGPGTVVATGDVVVIVESMKMEIPVESEVAGVVRRMLVAVGEPVAEGQAIAEIG